MKLFTDISDKSLPPMNSHAFFHFYRDSIRTLLAAGYTKMHIWRALKEHDPPFRGSYPTFWRRCRDLRDAQTPTTNTPKSPRER